MKSEYIIVNTIETLEPRPVWSLFKQICDIPHPSFHEIKLRDHIVDLCKEKGLATKIDETGNLLVYKAATTGMEDRKTVVMQGHIDMVPQKNADTDHDFVNDPIRTYVDGDWLTAEGTTLGADNGIGVAAGLAVMLADDIKHGPLELLCTIEEETAMTGAFGIKPGFLSADILLNLDTEDEGELYVGCAGGGDITATIDAELETTPANHTAFEIAIRGLLGGHSGLEIDRGRANANQLINRFLISYAEKLDIRVASFNGGSLRNAIPSESFTVISVNQNNEAPFKQSILDFAELMKAEYGHTENNISIEATPVGLPEKVISKKQQLNIQRAIGACVSGPLRMSDQFEGVVETSNNLAIVKSSGDQIEIQSLTRSLLNSARDFTVQIIAGTFDMIGAQTSIGGVYPGWKPNANSAVLQLMKEGYQSLYGVTPEVKVIHAGLECGLLGEPNPEMDMISFGPTIRGAHSPDERCHIQSVQKFWDFLLHTLEHIPSK